MSPETVVLDASVGVKWLKDEPGSDQARALIDDVGAGSVRIVVPSVFPFEVLDVARRLFGVAEARVLWEGLSEAGVLVAGSDTALVDASLEVAGRLGCTVYDAAAPALAERLGCPLLSADRCAHGRVAGVRLLG